jgi:hypothetical protein
MGHALCLCAVLAGAAGTRPQDAGGTPGSPVISIEAIDAAIGRGASWLAERQAASGAFEPASDRDACTVALTAMATWSLGELAPSRLEPDAVERAARYLLAQRREDGGIYDPARGLAVYTSGVAAQALATLAPRDDWPELGEARAAAELFAYRHGSPESIVDAVQPGEISVARAAEEARTLLERTPAADENRRRALDFLARSKREQVPLPSRLRNSRSAAHSPDLGAFTYDDLLPLIYVELAPEHQVALRARAALSAYYAADRNPDLTRRYGSAGFAPGTQGRFYYYFVAAKTMSVYRERTLATADGARHDWASELAAQLVRLQRDDGAWANSDPTWWESEPVLATSLALLTLVRCRDALGWTK